MRINNPRVHMRSLATRGSKSELSHATKEAIKVVKAAGYEFIIVETSGIGKGIPKSLKFVIYLCM
ncbi:putative protein kinase ArgK-like GTPase of G3E family [Neobacillus niacini]|uniref:hypothetical protein n=1 Tax=Neobacillus niacini TaxID=86668 RepID=UPI00286340D7|nr:putative protein kinase ArgK-like GTPase of G3E family [Neobacillus niacini]